MARTVDLLAEHWLKTRGERGHQKISIGGTEIEFWWSPWTLDQQDFVYHDWTPGETFRPERWARVVLRKAEKEDGTRMFADAEKFDLMNKVDPNIVKAMGTAILANLSADNKAARDANGEGDGPKGAPAGATPST